jgi:hypothetical protein
MRAHLPKLLAAALVAVLAACGPSRTTFARHPAAAIAFDRAGSDPKAVAIADKVIAAAGGAERWNHAHQIKWSEEYTNNGKRVLSMDQAWDRWNGRHNARSHNAADADYSVDTSHNPTQSKREGQGDVVVMRKLYEDGGNAFMDAGNGALQGINAEDVPRAVATARERWQFDTAVLCISFLLEEPGAKLSYLGEVAGEDGKPPLDAIKLEFDPRDSTRTSTYHVVVSRETNLVDRLKIIEKGQPDNRGIVFHLGEWTDVGGLKFATLDEDAGAKGQQIKFKNISIGEPDDALYVPSIQ